MSIDWINIIYPVIAITVSTSVVCYMFYQNYLSRVSTSKESNNVPDIAVAPEVFELVSRIALSATVKIADNPTAIPSAATFYWHPSYIIISRRVIGNRDVDAIQFKLQHLLALVAHEAGHIKPGGQWTFAACWSGVFATFLLSLIYLCNWTYLRYSLLGFVFFIVVCMITSWIDEFRADSFVIKDALIPVDDLAGALVAVKHQVDKEQYTLSALSKLTRNSLAILTHPPVYLRIYRLRKLYGK